MRLAFVLPMLPTLVDEPPEGGEWIHEIKFDGYRTQLIIDEDGIRLITRNGHDWTERYRPIADAAGTLGLESAIIDGEMIVTGDDGRPDFALMQRTIRSGKTPAGLAFIAFDLLHLDGHDLRAMHLVERRHLLEDIIGTEHEPIRFSQPYEGSGEDFYKAVDGLGLEGMVSKRTDSAYVSGRTRQWLKTKCYAEDTFDIVGAKREPGQPAMVLMSDQGRYMGGAFVTLPNSIRERLWKRVEQKAGGKPPVGKKASDATWVTPGLRGRVRFMKGEEMLRHAHLQEFSDTGTKKRPGNS